MPMIEMIMNTMEIIQATYPEDALVLLVNTEKLLQILPGKYFGQSIAEQLPVGTPIEQMKGTVTDVALHTGKVAREERDAARYGFAYISTAVPIYENGSVMGVFTAAISNERYDKLRVEATDLASMVEEMTATSETVTSASEDVTNNVQKAATMSKAVATQISDIGSIIEFVREVASKSNLLGLNAAIEAARAGEQGRGFAVVAGEIRKLADSSKSSAVHIREKLESIEQSIKALNDSIQQISAGSEDQLASMQELTAAFSRIAEVANEITISSTLANENPDY